MRAAEWYGGRVPVEDLNDARTTHGKRRVSARRGLAGEKSGFFSILLERQTGRPPHGGRPVRHTEL